MTQDATTFHNELVIGERVRYTTEASWGRATGSGVYLGVALDEEDGAPFHYFVDGEINGHAQASHGFPAAPGTPTTTELTPSSLIREALGVVLVVDGVACAFRSNDDGDVLCPCCGHDDVGLWADDGEADDADWFQCEKFSGGCGASGAVCLSSNLTRTLNGVAV